MKTFILLAIFLGSFSAFSQVWDHDQLADHQGYSLNVLKNRFLSASERIAIDKYAAYKIAYYEDINPYLRGQTVGYEYARDEEEIKFYVEKIDNGLRKVPALPKDLILFRGEGLGYRGNKPFQVGELNLQKAYVSTSTNEEEAKDFITSNGTLFIIYSTQKTFRGIVINETEDEVLLPRGLYFKVMKTRLLKDKGVRDSAYLALVQICESSSACESTVSNKHANALWESDTF